MFLFHSRSKCEDAKYLSNFTIVDEGMLIEDQHYPVYGGVLVGKMFPSIEHAFQGYKLAMSGASVTLIDDLIRTTEMSVVKRMGGRKFFEANNLKLDIQKWTTTSVSLMRYLVRQRLHKDTKYRDIIKKLIDNNIKIYHFERSGAKSIWGGYVSKSTGEWMGRNLLGQILVEEYQHL